MLLLLAFGSAAGQEASPGLPLRTPVYLESPAAAGSGEPNLYAAPDGRVFLSWIEPGARGGHALRFAVKHPGGLWSQPGTVAEGANWFVNWADFPSLIALPDGTLGAHWLVKSGPGTFAYDVNVARSTDGGKTWGRPLTPHRDGTKTEHGFVSFLAWPGGRLGAVWLDGRNFKGSSEHDGHGPSTKEMTLRFTTIDSKGNPAEETLLDGRVCECCQTSAAMTSEGAVVVYRDRSEREVRDISIVRYAKGRWSEPRTIHPDGWEIYGCPVNGPSVAAVGRRVAVAWFTGAKETPRVKLAFSTDGGASFGSPIQVDDGAPVGRVEVVLLADGSAMIAWLERVEKAGEIRVRRIGLDGKRDPAITIAQSTAARASGFPQLARSGDELVLAWTDSGQPPRVQTAFVKLSGKN
jgi:hypothetical protein